MEIPNLTSGENKVYISLVKIGETSIGDLLKISGVSHSKIYDILKRLSEKGLVSAITKNGKQYFLAANPEVLINMIEEEENKLTKEKDIIKNKIIPELKLLKKTQKVKPQLSAFEGLKGMKNVIDETLTEAKNGEEILIMGTPKKIVERAGGYLKDWQKKRIKQKIICKILCDPGAPAWNEDWWKQSKQKGLSKVKPLDSESPSYLIITKESVTTIYFGENILAFKIVQKDIASRYRDVFYELWRKK